MLNAIVGLAPAFRASLAEEDDDTAAGYSRIFVEAAETYLSRIARGMSDALPLVDILLACSAHKDLEVAQHTWAFWSDLAFTLSLTEIHNYAHHFVPLFARLVQVVAEHLRYPADTAQWTAAQYDDFSMFRHSVGDTLRDCATVLGGAALLGHIKALLESTLSSGANGGAQSWQHVEAVLFALRASASVISTSDYDALGPLMDMILSPAMPTNSKIKYTIVLIIARYAEWTTSHPEYIQAQLTCVFAGFDDEEAAAAAARAIKDLGTYCAPLMTPFLETLLQFHETRVASLRPVDQVEVVEGLGTRK